jgi:cytochrome d ubiquinol oxidase subunit II
VITPFFFGTVAGAVASGRVPAAGYGDRIGSWLNPTSLVGGCLAAVTCIFLAGVFLTADADRAGDHELAGRLRVRTLAVGIATGIVVFAGLYPVAHDAPTLSHGLRTAASPLLAVAAVAGIATLALLYRRRFSLARIPAVAAVGSVVIGWGVAQFPWLLADQVTIDDGAGADATLVGLLVVVALAGVVVLPALTYLLRLTQQWTRA